MNPSTRTSATLIGGILAAELLAIAALPVHAQDHPFVVDAPHKTTYLNGGIGSDEEHYMRTIAQDWPLRMTFAQSPGGEFVAGVRLLVTDIKGEPYLQLNDAGPMTYARLPAGKYRIVASYQGRSETREVVIDGKSGRGEVFDWQHKAG